MTTNLAWNGTNSTTINGLPAQQNEIAAPLWEAFFRIQSQRYRAVEIGTGTGGFTRHIAQFVEHIITFDTVNRWATENVVLDFSNPNGYCPINRQILDVMTNQSMVAKAITGEHVYTKPYAELPVVLFCDGGNKPLEMKTFAPYLLKGDVIAVHDFAYTNNCGSPPNSYYWQWCEFTEKDLIDSEQAHRCRTVALPFYRAAWGVWEIDPAGDTTTTTA